MKTRRPLLTALITLAAASSLPAAAEGVVLHLSASAQREVANDEMNATLYVQERHPQPGTLAERLNALLARAQAAAKRYPKVELSSGSYNSWPEHDKNGKLQGWQGRAEVKLRGRDNQEMGKLVAELQSFMLLSGVDFRVSDETRRATEKALIPEAVRDLQEQASTTALALGKTRSDIRELNIGDVPVTPQPVMKAYAMRADAAAAPAPVEWQGGRSVIQLNLSGKVELN